VCLCVEAHEQGILGDSIMTILVGAGGSALPHLQMHTIVVRVHSALAPLLLSSAAASGWCREMTRPRDGYGLALHVLGVWHQSPGKRGLVGTRLVLVKWSLALGASKGGERLPLHCCRGLGAMQLSGCSGVRGRLMGQMHVCVLPHTKVSCSGGGGVGLVQSTRGSAWLWTCVLAGLTLSQA
jgi:hypothetical protein